MASETPNNALKRELHLAEKDKYGNLADGRYDLGKDGAFSGMTIAVLHFYTALTFDFEKPKAALKEKGFSIHRWIRDAPSINEFQTVLDKSCQLWIISSSSSKLSDAHLQIIKRFFDQGKGLFLWGDNEPYFMDANKVVKYLGVSALMSGNVPGGKIVNSGIRTWHPIATGLQCLFEGITIASIKWTKDNELDALVYGSEDNVVSAVYERDGKRMLLDGGFTRLFCNWDSAGTSRYIKNAAVWLANLEKST